MPAALQLFQPGTQVVVVGFQFLYGLHQWRH